MNRFTFLLFIIISFDSRSQDKVNEIAEANFAKTQIGINASLDVGYRLLENNFGFGSSIADTIIEMRNESEIPKIGYTTGLNALFNLKSNFSLETGLQYSNKGYQTKMTDLIAFQPIDSLMPEKMKSIYNYHYVDVPFRFIYVIGRNKIRFLMSAGVTANIFIKETHTSVRIYSDRKERNTNPTAIDYKRVNFSPMLSLGIDYKINREINLRIEPTFRYGVLKIIDAPVSGYLYNGGLNISCYYSF